MPRIPLGVQLIAGVFFFYAAIIAVLGVLTTGLACQGIYSGFRGEQPGIAAGIVVAMLGVAIVGSSIPFIKTARGLRKGEEKARKAVLVFQSLGAFGSVAAILSFASHNLPGEPFVKLCAAYCVFSGVIVGYLWRRKSARQTFIITDATKNSARDSRG